MKKILILPFLWLTFCANQKQPFNSVKFLKPFVFGANKICTDNSECDTGICYYDICAGVTLASNDWMINEIAKKILKAVALKKISISPISGELKKMIDSTDVFTDLKRGRLLKFLILVDKNQGLEKAKKFFECNTQNCSFYLKFISAVELARNKKQKQYVDYLKKIYKTFGKELRPYLYDLAEVTSNKP